ncbi:BspA family leucine-rich repeat surface protein [Muricauda sp. HICW]|uniref:BspA family leucine-rich repeat surface protein n=1 Tax=Flagellimonas chongwuensis TaxID=2697365 RepID=A0A850NGG3_9FLAO|nr:BspA family leucine-rich repeat surface protein [Allomuricauda chongwuensis]NVN18356.1 BspA family leucine-rich repeat surface protein [Allomuricauda chongwuensis]
MKKLLFTLAIMAIISSCAKDDSPGAPPPSSKPTITDFTPKSGTVDTEVTITGTNFSVTAADNEVMFGTVAANVSNATPTKIVVHVPAGAITSKITVTVDDETATSTDTFTVNTETLEMADQEFTASEDFTDSDEIGQVTITGAGGNTLTFSITDSELFAISNTGMLTLAQGKLLDFETATSHIITVSVTNGEDTVDATITITVEDVAEADPKDKAAFVTTWKTENDEEDVSFYLSDDYAYNFVVNWGDGTVETINTADAFPANGEVIHTYSSAGAYSVAIYGEMPWFVVGPENQNALKLSSMDQWGNNVWQDLSYAFASCANMVYNATDMPDLSEVTNLSHMFAEATSFNGDISDWITSNVTNMSYMFAVATSFNGDLSEWDTSNVTDMLAMFYEAELFNNDISGWDTSNVTTMEGMFGGALSFNQNLGSWDISNVEQMGLMLTNSGMSTVNYENTLLGWSVLDEGETQVPLNITLGATGLTYCTSAGKTVLVDDFSWTINDDGFDPNCL